MDDLTRLQDRTQEGCGEKGVWDPWAGREDESAAGVEYRGSLVLYSERTDGRTTGVERSQVRGCPVGLRQDKDERVSPEVGTSRRRGEHDEGKENLVR